jgi:hypothetical protein
LCPEHESVDVVVRLLSLESNHEEARMMRSIGLDIHRDFCEVAIAEAGEIRCSKWKNPSNHAGVSCCLVTGVFVPRSNR